MLKPALPESEPVRISGLNALNILDTAPETRFDRITRICTTMFNVPIALVSLVDTDRQWFKSKQGLEAEETGRDISFCGHAILDDKVFVVEDASKDERFADNPLVTGDPNIRFYAGCPLHAFGSLRIGTLCLIDTEPRVLPDEDIALLKYLASIVERELADKQLPVKDDITGLANFNGLQSIYDELTGNSKEKHPLTAARVRIDRFKYYDRKCGELVARNIAAILNQTLGEYGLVSRIQNDEFIALIPNHDASDITDSMHEVIDLLAEEDLQCNKDYSPSISFGIKQYAAGSHKDIHALIDDAGIAIAA